MPSLARKSSCGRKQRNGALNLAKIEVAVVVAPLQHGRTASNDDNNPHDCGIYHNLTICNIQPSIVIVSDTFLYLDLWDSQSNMIAIVVSSGETGSLCVVQADLGLKEALRLRGECLQLQHHSTIMLIFSIPNNHRRPDHLRLSLLPHAYTPSLTPTSFLKNFGCSVLYFLPKPPYPNSPYS